MSKQNLFVDPLARLHCKSLKYLFFLTLNLLASSALFSQAPAGMDSIPQPTPSRITLTLDPSSLAKYDYSPPVNYWRVAAVTGASAATLGLSYVYVKNSWWAERPSTFHFDEGKDLRYSHNIDKFAHFYGGAIGTDLFYGALRWAHLSESSAYLFGAGLSSFVQFAMEMKDAFAPRWGFSVYDVCTGVAGAFLPVGKRYVPALRDIDIKWSYYKKSQHYFDINPHGTANDDYEGQTYWVAIKVNNLLPQSLEKIWPDIFGIAIGMSLDTENDGNGGGNVEWFLALDYDLTHFIPSNNSFWEGVKHYLNYIHLPSPAIRFTPSIVWYGLYF